MRHSSPTPLRRRGTLLRLVSVGLLALLVVPYGASFAASPRGTGPAVNPAAAGSLSGSVMWNGVSTNTAPTAASPIGWTFSQIATVVFTWTGPAGGPGVSQAFLVVLFLGLPAYTKQQVVSPAIPSAGGSISMTYDLTQFKWIVQGLYQIHAYLEDPSGNNLWGETFYVKVAQPFDFVVATVGLLIITVIELYMIATVGPRAADKVRKQQPPPEEPARPTEAPVSTPDAPASTTDAPTTSPEKT